MTETASERSRARLRVLACAVAALGGVVALGLSPGLVQPEEPRAALRLVQAGFAGGVVALAVVAISNLLAQAQPRLALATARAGTWLGVLVMAGYTVVAAFLAPSAVSAVALPLAPAVLLVAAAAVLVGFLSLRLGDPG